MEKSTFISEAYLRYLGYITWLILREAEVLFCLSILLNTVSHSFKCCLINSHVQGCKGSEMRHTDWFW